MPPRVVVVTDSTAYLPAELVARYDIRVVPLHVVVGSVSGAEGTEVRPADVVRALSERRAVVTTSRPSPAAFTAVYQEAFDAGADGVVSVHLSSTLSGTYDSAVTAAASAPGPVAVVDSRSTAMALGFAVLSAVDTAGRGAGMVAARDAAEATAARATTLFYVDSLEHIRRGGRMSAAASLVGTALAVKPILHVADGQIVLKEKVRTASRGLARLADLAVAAAGERGCDLAIHHLGAAEKADALRSQMATRLPGVDQVVVSEVGAAVGAHVGPGLVGVVVVAHPPST